MTEVLFNGHAGRLEGRYHQSDKPGAPIALILHPHPHSGIPLYVRLYPPVLRWKWSHGSFHKLRKTF